MYLCIRKYHGPEIVVISFFDEERSSDGVYPYDLYGKIGYLQSADTWFCGKVSEI